MNSRKEVESLLKTLKKHGVHVTGVDSGPDQEWEFPSLDNIMTCGVATLGLRYLDTTEHTVMKLVLGNEPGYIVSDWLIPRGNNFANAIDNAVDEHNAEWGEQ